MERDATQITLLEAARIVARGGGLDSELAALAGHVCTATGALAAAIYLLDPVAGQLVVAAGSGIDASAVSGAAPVSANDASDIAARAATERRAVTGSVAPAVLAGLGAAPGGVIGVPLIATDASGAEETEGVLVAAFAEAPDLGADNDPLLALADLCAVAIRKARLTNALVERSEWIERLASTDALTGLANRATFERMLELEIARARRQQLELSVVVFDVEDFGGLNEREGHAAGDDVLRRLASLLADEVRLVDTIGRLAGDRFGLIAPGGGGDIVAGRVREAAAQLRSRAGAPIGVRAATVVFPRDGDATADLMAAAAAAIAGAIQHRQQGHS